MSILPFLAILNILLVANAHNISFGKPSTQAERHSVSARQAGAKLEGCGLKDQSFVCDTDSVLTQEERDQLFRFLKSLELETRNPFGKTECERKGLTVGVAISKTKIIPGEEKQPTTTAASDQGHDWNEHNHHSYDEPDNEEDEEKRDDKNSKSLPDVQLNHHHIPNQPIPPSQPSTSSFPTFGSSSGTELTPCFVAGGLSLTQLLNHNVDNNNRFARELIRGWGIDNETCVEKSAVILLSPVNPQLNPESDDLNCYYADKTNSFRHKRYLDGLIEILEEQRQIYLDVKLYSAIETCRSLALPGAAPFLPPIPESTSSKPSSNTPPATNSYAFSSPTSSSYSSRSSTSNYQQESMLEEQHFERMKQLEAEQLQKQQKNQYVQCSPSHTTNTLLVLLFLTITSQTLLLVAIVVLKMRGFFNKPAGAIVPSATVTSPPPMYNVKPVLSPSSFFDHLEEKINENHK